MPMPSRTNAWWYVVMQSDMLIPASSGRLWTKHIICSLKISSGSHLDPYWGIQDLQDHGLGACSCGGPILRQTLEIMIWRHRDLKLQWSSLLFALIFNCNVKFYFWELYVRDWLKVNRRQVEDKWRETNKKVNKKSRQKGKERTNNWYNWGRSRWQGRKNDISVMLIQYPRIPFQNLHESRFHIQAMEDLKAWHPDLDVWTVMSHLF